jgi:hypothetical protein
MFITVPMGILVVGASVGVAEALKAGLNKRLLPMISGKSSTERRRKAKTNNSENESGGEIA